VSVAGQVILPPTPAGVRAAAPVTAADFPAGRWHAQWIWSEPPRLKAIPQSSIAMMPGGEERFGCFRYGFHLASVPDRVPARITGQRHRGVPGPGPRQRPFAPVRFPRSGVIAARWGQLCRSAGAPLRARDPVVGSDLREYAPRGRVAGLRGARGWHLDGERPHLASIAGAPLAHRRARIGRQFSSRNLRRPSDAGRLARSGL
jgi:hypothetical protein